MCFYQDLWNNMIESHITTFVTFFSNSCMICLSSLRSFSDYSTYLRTSLWVRHVCEQSFQPVWALPKRLHHVPGCQAVPPMSQSILPAQWNMCGGLSKVLVLFSYFFYLHKFAHRHNTANNFLFFLPPPQVGFLKMVYASRAPWIVHPARKIPPTVWAVR